MACKENQVEENVSRTLQREIEEYRINMFFFTLKEAEAIVNFISTDYENRRIRDELVWCNDHLRKDAYWYLSNLLEFMGQNTPLSIVDKEKNMALFSCLVKQVKRSFEGAWLDELVGFLHENEKYLGYSVNDLKRVKKSHKRISKLFRNEVRFFTERCQETLDQLQQTKAQIEEAKKANRKRQRDDDDRLEELERSEQTLREKLEELGRYKDESEIRLKDFEAKLMEIRQQLKHAPNFRAKLAAVEFDFFSPTIIRNKLTSPKFDRWPA